MKKAKVFFHPIEGSAPLSLSWHQGPKGDAVEANNGIGVGYFSPTGELLGVMFDDVSAKKDHQALEFDRYRVEVTTDRGDVSYSLATVAPKKRSSKSRRAKGEDAA